MHPISKLPLSSSFRHVLVRVIKLRYMTDKHYVILKEYFCVYFAGYYKVEYLCLTDDIVLTYFKWAELTVIYSIVYFN